MLAWSETGVLLSPLMFSLFISAVAGFVRENGKHCIQLIPGFEEIFLLLFADDIVLISSTPSGLQNHTDNLENASKSLDLIVNLDKTKLLFSEKEDILRQGKTLLTKTVLLSRHSRRRKALSVTLSIVFFN